MQIFVIKKEFQKNTKANMPSKPYCSQFSQEGPLDLVQPIKFLHKIVTLIIALSRVNHVDQHRSHIVIWQYGQNMAILPFGYMTIWCSWYGCLWRKQYKCSQLVKESNWTFLGETRAKSLKSHNWPLYFSEITFYLQESAHRA